VVNLRSLAEDKEGNIWAGLLGGGLAVRRPDGRHEILRQADGLKSDLVRSLCPASDGGLWIGTEGGGLNRLKDGRFSAVTTAHGLPGNTIAHLLADGLGFLWLDTEKGLFRVSEKSLFACAEGRSAALAGEAYGRSDGLPSQEIPGAQAALTRTADGRLWFCTAKGLVWVDPGALPDNRSVPRFAIEDLTVDGQLRPPTGGMVTVPAGPKRLQVRYTAFSFAAPEKTRFRTRLAGLELDWTEAGTDREAVFHLLPPGNYRFEVIASSHGGVWATEPAVQAFVVQPFFWQTWWFRLGAGALLVGTACLAGIGAARARLQRRIDEAERQRAIEHERARIARDIHDDLGASLTRLTLLSQTAMTENTAGRSTGVELDAIYTTARELTRSMDEIVWAVNPRHDSLDSLANFLGKYAQEYLRAAQIRCRLDLPAGLPPTPVPAEVRHNVFLATKEVLHNSVKHAGTSEVRIALAAMPDGFKLTLEDNGRGFLPTAADEPANGSPSRRDGLANLHRRLADSGGSCQVESAPGQGTRTTFTVSLRGRRAEPGREANIV
jgi:signal transduction histidine kinase